MFGFELMVLTIFDFRINHFDSQKADDLWHEHGRFHNSAENQVVFNARRKALFVLDSLLNFESDLHLRV